MRVPLRRMPGKSVSMLDSAWLDGVALDTTPNDTRRKDRRKTERLRLCCQNATRWKVQKRRGSRRVRVRRWQKRIPACSCRPVWKVGPGSGMPGGLTWKNCYPPFTSCPPVFRPASGIPIPTGPAWNPRDWLKASEFVWSVACVVVEK